MLDDTRELLLVRLRLLDLIKSFFQSEPDAEKMSRWRGMFSALAKEQVSPLFDAAVREFHMHLNTKSLDEITAEYYTLFIDPFSKSQMNTTASYYLDGRTFGESLVLLRSFLGDAGLTRAEGVVDSEDSIVMMLDIFSSLIEEERQLQVKLLTEFLAPFGGKFNEAMEKNDSADFYKSCSKLLMGYLDLEKGLVTVS